MPGNDWYIDWYKQMERPLENGAEPVLLRAPFAFVAGELLCAGGITGRRALFCDERPLGTDGCRRDGHNCDANNTDPLLGTAKAAGSGSTNNHLRVPGNRYGNCTS